MVINLPKTDFRITEADTSTASANSPLIDNSLMSQFHLTFPFSLLTFHFPNLGHKSSL